MAMTTGWWTLVYYHADWSDGEKQHEWSERSARNVLAMARVAEQRVRLEHWTPSCVVLSDDRPGAASRVVTDETDAAAAWAEVGRLRTLIEERFGARPCCGVPFNAPRCDHGPRAVTAKA
jgi:hypothetical protein